MVYHICDWDRIYENSESKKYKRLHWVAIPNKHEGKGWGRLREQENRVDLFCAWVLMVEMASKMPKRGFLGSVDDGPLSAEDMAYSSGFPQNIFDDALTFFEGPIGWIEEVSEDLMKPTED